MSGLERLDKEAKRRGLELVRAEEDWAERTMSTALVRIAVDLRDRWEAAGDQMTAKQWSRVLCSARTRETCAAMSAFARDWGVLPRWYSPLNEIGLFAWRLEGVRHQVVQLHPATTLGKQDIEARLLSEDKPQVYVDTPYHPEWWKFEVDGTPREQIVIQNRGWTAANNRTRRQSEQPAGHYRLGRRALRALQNVLRAAVPDDGAPRVR